MATTYKLIFDGNGGSGCPPTSTISSENTSYTFTISSVRPSYTGHTFKGWAQIKSATTAQYQPGDTIVLTSSSPTKTLYAVWDEITYKIIVESDPSIGGSVSPSGSITRPYGTTVTLNATPSSRYVFKQWQKNGSTISTDSSFTVSVTSNATYTAIFELKKYIISYKNGGHGVAPGSQTKEFGTAIMLRPAIDDERENTPASTIKFDHNNETAEYDTRTSYKTTIFKQQYWISEESRRYSPNEYYDLDADAIMTASWNEVEGTKFSTITTPTGSAKAGYDFKYWNTQQDGSGRRFNENTSYNPLQYTELQNNPTLYAIYDDKCDIVVTSKKGATVTGGGRYNVGDSCTIDAVIDDGYTFDSWSLNGTKIEGSTQQYTFTVDDDATYSLNLVVQGKEVAKIIIT